MAIPRKWYNEAVFYHIYPLGLTGAPKQNPYGETEHRLNTLLPWIEHLKNLGITALYIGPLFESVGHGYETTDYKKVDSRLGDNADLKNFVAECHNNGIRVILDGVFNHTGRDFFAFKDIKQNRENSVYKDWYCNVNFWGNNEYNDGFSYGNWGGYNLLAKLNQKHPAVRDYLCDVVRFWVSEFDIDGIRLDAADVLDFSFMQALRRTADEVKPDFWLMGEVIHGDYNRWVNDNTLHSVTNYHLHKALYSGHNDHNYFEIAHTVKRLYDMTANGSPMQLYNFTDNHDVERIYTKLTNKTHFLPTHILLYTLPGVPSIYYGSEFGIEGRKERHSDDSLRPCLALEELQKDTQKNTFAKIISRLGEIRKETPALSYGDYKEVLLTNRQYAFSRTYNGETVFVCVNNDDNTATLTLRNASGTYTGLLSGTKVSANNGFLQMNLPANSGEIFICTDKKIEPAVLPQIQPIETKKEPVRVTEPPAKPTPTATVEPEAQKQVATPPAQPVPTPTPQPAPAAKPKADANNPTPDFCDCIPTDKPYEEMTVEQLQQVIFEKMKKNGPVTERMYKDIADNTYHNSLVTWAKSF
ncbi:MAG: alpha-amylase [Ruminococcaceae bacterium]|nr:alpha-amylase [Oscillospiraceae bacterium]